MIEDGFNRHAMAADVADGSIAYVELYVVDAVAALEYFTGAFAFTAIAVAEYPDRYSVLLASGSARLVVTEPRSGPGGSAVADWLRVHGDGVRDIALYRSYVGEVVERAAGAGRPVLVGPTVDVGTGVGYARVGGFGSVRHTLLDIWPATDLPAGFAWKRLRSFGEPASPPAALQRIDHIAVCLPAGALESTVAAYQSIFGMQIIRSERVEVGDAAMNSQVLRDAAGVTYVMAEPDPAHALGQVDQFLATHCGAGVQNLAFLTEDIVAAVEANLQAFAGWRFRPRVAADVSAIDISVKLLGFGWQAPIAIAPTALHELCTPAGELATAAATAEVGLPLTVSTFTSRTIEELAAAHPQATLWQQVYVFQDRAVTASLVDRAEAAGVGAVVVTVDSPWLGRRHRDRRGEFTMPPGLQASRAHVSLLSWCVVLSVRELRCDNYSGRRSAGSLSQFVADGFIRRVEALAGARNGHSDRAVLRLRDGGCYGLRPSRRCRAERVVRL